MSIFDRSNDFFGYLCIPNISFAIYDLIFVGYGRKGVSSRLVVAGLSLVVLLLTWLYE